MTGNIVEDWSQVIWVVVGILVLCAFALALALPQKTRGAAARNGLRPEADEATSEEIRPDGYIDSFSHEIEEAGGSLPPVMKLAIPVVVIWWIGYVIMNWSSAGGQ